MSAVINERAASSTTSLGNGVKPGKCSERATNADAPCLDLVQKLEAQIARVTKIILLTKEDGVLTIGEDRTVRFILKRDSGQFWPSIVEYLPNVPTALSYDEESMRYANCWLARHIRHFCLDSSSDSSTDASTSTRSLRTRTA